ncbi:MAG: GntR family transcriptional regulator [Eubacterium sp.]
MKIKIQDIIMSDILKDIKSGILKPGEKLPTNIVLAKKYNTSGVTVRKSIATLVSQGYLESRERVGTYVKAHQANSFIIPFSPFMSINEPITHYNVEGLTLSLIRMPNSDIEKKAVEFRQLFFADNLPICYHIFSLISSGHFNENRIMNETVLNQSFEYLLSSFEISKGLTLTMDLPPNYILDKLLLDTDSPLFCLTLHYYTKATKPVGKSIFYISSENIDLPGKSINL